MWKRLNLDYTTTWYMYKPESVQENETLKILGDFEIEMDHLIPVRRSRKRELAMKLILSSCGPGSENERNWKDGQVFGSCLRTENAVEHEGDGDTNCNWCTWHCHKKLGRNTGGTESHKKNRGHPDYNIVEIGLNTQKIPGHIRKLTVTKTPVKNQQLIPVGKTHKEW